MLRCHCHCTADWQALSISEMMLDAFHLIVCYHTYSNYFFLLLFDHNMQPKTTWNAYICSHIRFQWQMNSLPQNCFASLFFTDEQCSLHRNFAKTANTDKHVSVKFNHFQIESRKITKHFVVSEDCAPHFNSLNSKQSLLLSIIMDTCNNRNFTHLGLNWFSLCQKYSYQKVFFLFNETTCKHIFRI